MDIINVNYIPDNLSLVPDNLSLVDNGDLGHLYNLNDDVPEPPEPIQIPAPIPTDNLIVISI
jgi:hypothetical protein